MLLFLLVMEVKKKKWEENEDTWGKKPSVSSLCFMSEDGDTIFT